MVERHTGMIRGMALLVVLALVAAACGDTDEADPITTTSTTTGPTTSSTTSPPANLPTAFEPTANLGRSAPPADAPVGDLVAGFNDSGFELLRAQAVDDNLVLSPSSIAHALLMARAATDPATGAALADRIWPRLDVRPDQQWIDLLAAEHGADVQPLDFTGDPGGSTDVINDWINDQTDGLIPELLPPGFISGQTVLVLTDALDFKARWETIFGKYGPVTGDFTRLDGTTAEVDFLQQLELPGPRGTGDGFVGAEIPYAGADFSMLVIVPDTGRFADVRGRLGQGLLDEIDRTFTTGPYELRLPPWSNKTEIDLLPWLTDIGAAPGNYPSISPGAFLDAAVHGADIEVDEWGTVAAAATAFGFAESGPPEPELTVWADRPFLYAIRHVESGLVLFAGQVTDLTS